MEIEVTQPGRKPFFVYPKLFINDRTRQVMANPDIRSTPFQDFYVSPIDFDPGQPQVQLAKGESGQIGGMDSQVRRTSTSTRRATPWRRWRPAGW